MKFKFYLRVDEEIEVLGAIKAINLLTVSRVQAKIDGKTKRQPKYTNFPDGTARCFFIHLKI